MDWPYPVAYGKENEVGADVLILGGGVAGCHAAISAAKRGAKVVVVEKGATIRSGSGGPGVDHWHGACTNPCSRITPEELVALVDKLNGGYLLTREYGNGITSYILFKESWDALQDVEGMGVKVRDVDDEFKGAEFRDEATKLLFAYDYDNRFTIRVNGGADIKVALYKEAKRLGVRFFDRVMATSLLTEGGQPGGRVIGATGLHTRTGEFYLFTARATILSTASPAGLWIFSTELAGDLHPLRPQQLWRRHRHGLGSGRRAGTHGAKLACAGFGRLRLSHVRRWQRSQHLVRVQHRRCQR